MAEPEVLSPDWPSPTQVRALRVRAAMRGHQTHQETGNMRRFLKCERCKLSLGMLHVLEGWTPECEGRPRTYPWT